MLFMLLYYRTGGNVANIALILCLLFLLSVLAAFQGTLTLPGIAGIILTLAVAVDANVLIYERIREEVLTGKTFRASIDAGYDRAWQAILDSCDHIHTGLIRRPFAGPSRVPRADTDDRYRGIHVHRHLCHPRSSAS
jgi:protein-export membrane protein SecD